MIDATCDGCIYAIPLILEDGDVLEKCRRYPPTLFVVDGVVNQGSPDADKRCGEFKEETLVVIEEKELADECTCSGYDFAEAIDCPIHGRKK